MSSVTFIPDQAHKYQSGMADTPSPHIGWWTGNSNPVGLTESAAVLREFARPVYILDRDGEFLASNDGAVLLDKQSAPDDALPVSAWLPPLDPRRLGDISFCNDYRIRFPYMTGAMANGIASTRVVKAVAGAGMLSTFGAAGLPVQQVADAIDELQAGVGNRSFCINLIHSPNETGKEDKLVDLFIVKRVHLVEASAYLALTLPAVRYRVHGIHRDNHGNIVTPNRIIAKASRIEVAGRWFSPPPENMLGQLLDNGDISAEEYELAQHVPMAQDLTVEADSGGHTDNRPAITLLPTMLALRDRLQKQYGYGCRLRVGLAGGIATPSAAAAAFAMGAAYIVTGTINQACIESGSSDIVRNMLAGAQQADIAMAAAGDMFEMGVKVQVLKRGTMFAMRANKLYELYRACNSLEEIPAKDRETLEKTVFRAPLDEIWQNTSDYFQSCDPGQISKAEQDPKHKMALVFRWYLGLSSRWANAGVEDRQADYQVWCGPAMGAFNEWTRGSFLEQPANRKVVTVAMNLLFGAAFATRINSLRCQGVNLPVELANSAPLEVAEIENYL